MQMIKTIAVILLLSHSLWAQNAPKNANPTAALSVRNIGPAFTSGRIGDLAVDLTHPGTYYVAAASGGVWKTQNWGTTFTPIFDHQGSYSIGCISISPHHSQEIWVGTGENNNQRSVSYGDGVYQSLDGGKTWKNMGLKNSEHISKVIIHPNDPQTIYVAAYGPLWKDGGERGVYESNDGGATWKNILNISKYTGISDLIIDPSNPKIMYAAAHMRRRHVWTYIGGGEESGVFKTIDGGKTWKRIENGLPQYEMGRIGLSLSAHQKHLYAIVEAKYQQGGIYMSDNQGATWEKQSNYSTSGNYYQEIIPDPINDDKFFIMDTWLHHSEDHGKTVVSTGEDFKHVDNHAMWINPNNTNHWLVGCDGGLYETYDHGSTWDFKSNLPITQFYKVAVDQDYPFFNVYGGTQDNSSQGGPSQTRNQAGITNADWFITNGGDGFESAIDPTDPNIVYAQSQYGWLVRYHKKTGEKMGIQPMPGKDEAAYRFNWDAPLLISPHDHKRLYFAAQKVFRSDNYGNDWQVISPDLSKGGARNDLPVMDKIWSVDAVMKNKSTTIYGNIVALDESRFQENLLVAGTDDGNIFLSKNAKDWSALTLPKELPSNRIYVNNLIFSKHKKERIYAVFNHHKSGDFSPYIYKTEDLGKSWTAISGDLPNNGSAFDILEDHDKESLIFVGTEFGAYVSCNSGKNYFKIPGIPTIAIRDLEIHERTNSLVMASFGRGFFILDDYSYLRKEITPSNKLLIHTPDTVLQYHPMSPLGGRGNASQGHSYFTAENQKVGLHLKTYIGNHTTSLKDKRKKKELENLKLHQDNPYPSYEDLRTENEEQSDYIIYQILDFKGKEIYREQQSFQTGWQQWYWNLRLPTTTPIKLQKTKPGRYSMEDVGPMVLPGKYQVKASIYNHEYQLQHKDSSTFYVKDIDQTLNDVNILKDRIAFQEQVSEIRRLFSGISKIINDSEQSLNYISHAQNNYPNLPYQQLGSQIKEANILKDSLIKMLYGDSFKAQFEVETTPSVYDRVEIIVYQSWGTQMQITNNQKRSFEIVAKELNHIFDQSKKLAQKIKSIETWLGNYQIPYTPNRTDNWKKE